MGHWLKLSKILGHLSMSILASTSVPFRPTTVQMPKIELIDTLNGLQCAALDSYIGGGIQGVFEMAICKCTVLEFYNNLWGLGTD